MDVTIKEGPMKGKKVPVIAQVGKTGWMYILDRETGKPVFGVEERPVAKGDAPGEWYAPTQPFPLKPPHLGRIDFKPEDMVTADDTTPEHAKACKELYDRSGGFYNAGAFTPFLYQEDGKPPRSTIIFPGATGGTNWGGMATDPKEGYVFAYVQNMAQVGWTEKKRPGVEYGSEGGGPALNYARASVDGPGPFHTFSVQMKDADGKVIGTLAVPETTMGPAVCGGCQNRRLRMVGAAGDHAGAAARKTEHRAVGKLVCGTDSNGRWSRVHRLGARQPVPHAGFEDRKGTVEFRPWRAGECESDGVPGEERQRVCGDRGGKNGPRVRTPIVGRVANPQADCQSASSGNRHASL